MFGLLVEVNHPTYGLERYKIRIVRRFNVPTDTLEPMPKRRVVSEQLSCLVVGRGVSEKEIMEYITEHFKRTGMWERVLLMKMV
jgi:hypothetical protein